MKNMQPTTPGFVLTSLSLNKRDRNLSKSKKQLISTTQQSSIIKFDYCLPPDEFNFFEAADNQPAA